MDAEMFDTAVLDLIHQTSIRVGLDPYLVAALIKQESGGDRWAFRPEPRFPYLWDVRQNRPFRKLTEVERVGGIPPEDFPALGCVAPIAEWEGQRCSWGLMQVMGATARELGLREPFVTSILRPETNIEFGCRYLRRMVSRYGVENGVSAYNAGAPTSRNFEPYTAKILRFQAEFRDRGL